MSTQANIMPANDPALADLIARIESSRNSHAIRFERKTFARITNQGYTPVLSTIQAIHHCSSDTARVLYSMSFGFYQIMGFNLWGRALQYDKDAFSFIDSPADQKTMFFKFLDSIHQNITVDSLRDETSRNAFAIAYNGSTAYADKIIDLL